MKSIRCNSNMNCEPNTLFLILWLVCKWHLVQRDTLCGHSKNARKKKNFKQSCRVSWQLTRARNSEPSYLIFFNSWVMQHFAEDWFYCELILLRNNKPYLASHILYFSFSLFKTKDWFVISSIKLSDTQKLRIHLL